MIYRIHRGHSSPKQREKHRTILATGRKEGKKEGAGGEGSEREVWWERGGEELQPLGSSLALLPTSLSFTQTSHSNTVAHRQLFLPLSHSIASLSFPRFTL